MNGGLAHALERDPVAAVRRTLTNETNPRIVDLATLAALEVEAGRGEEARLTFLELAAVDARRRAKWLGLMRVAAEAGSRRARTEPGLRVPRGGQAASAS